MSAKIAFFIPNFSGGGAERVIVNLANYFSSYMDVHIVCVSKGGPYLRLVDPKVTIYELKVNKTLLSTFEFYRYLKSKKISVVLSTLRTPNIAVGLLKKIFNPYFSFKWVAREANTFNKQENSFKHKIINFLCMLSYKNADLIISNSNDTKDTIVDFLNIKEKCIKVIPNPVLLSEQITKRDRGIEKKLNIINVGRLVEQKNQKELIYIAERLVNVYGFTDFIISVYGEGELKNSLNDLIKIKNLSDYVKIKNFTSDIMMEYKKSDLFLLVSLWEGFGNVLVEALSQGIPVYSYKCPGGPQVIIDSNNIGLLFNVNDIDEVCRYIVKYHNRDIVFDPDSIVKRAHDFSIENVATLYLKEIEILSEAINQ